jgi:hypothetical protein
MPKDGLKLKYRISKADGSPVSEDGEYFVLKLNSKDINHRLASADATLAYAKSIGKTNSALAIDLENWVERCLRGDNSNVQADLPCA